MLAQLFGNEQDFLVVSAAHPNAVCIFPTLNFVLLLIILAFAASRPRARRISRLLATERAPVGTGLAGSADAVCVVAGGSPDAKVRGASGRGLLGRDSRQRGVLALGFVVGALGKP